MVVVALPLTFDSATWPLAIGKLLIALPRISMLSFIGRKIDAMLVS
jgi:hypothetical protein